MTQGRVQDQSGYAVLVKRLAQQALAIAVDGAAFRARQGERRWAMACALPAARVLLGEDVDHALLADASAELLETLQDPTGKITDGFGHARPVYRYFALHLMGSAARLCSDEAVTELIGQASAVCLQDEPAQDSNDPRLAVWRRLLAVEHGVEQAEQIPLASDGPAPLLTLGPDDLIDAWTYRELVGLHGLHLCAVLENDASLASRAASAAEYHLGHTQPDYTTYQPWALAAFAHRPATAVFAEQQLHDVATHLSIEGPGGAVLPALLLAEASAAMSGRFLDAWSESR